MHIFCKWLNWKWSRFETVKPLRWKCEVLLSIISNCFLSRPCILPVLSCSIISQCNLRPEPPHNISHRKNEVAGLLVPTCWGLWREALLSEQRCWVGDFCFPHHTLSRSIGIVVALSSAWCLPWSQLYPQFHEIMYVTEVSAQHLNGFVPVKHAEIVRYPRRNKVNYSIKAFDIRSQPTAALFSSWKWWWRGGPAKGRHAAMPLLKAQSACVLNLTVFCDDVGCKLTFLQFFNFWILPSKRRAILGKEKMKLTTSFFLLLSVKWFSETGSCLQWWGRLVAEVDSTVDHSQKCHYHFSVIKLNTEVESEIQFYWRCSVMSSNDLVQLKNKHSLKVIYLSREECSFSKCCHLPL